MPFLINVHDSDYQANNTFQATEHSLKNLFIWNQIPCLYRIKQIITMFTQAMCQFWDPSSLLFNGYWSSFP